MDAPRQMPLPLDYDGAERPEADPKTEQDHPELYEPEAAELQ